MVSARAVRELLDDRPDIEPVLAAVLEPEPPWSFDDVDVDPGRFGELVDRGIVERTDGGYRVADPDAVERGLDPAVADRRTTDRREPWVLSPDPDRLEVAALVGGILLVVALRLTSAPTVFLDEHVVLSGNDPYYYRFWVDGLLSNPDVKLSALPGGVTRGEPLYVVSIWLVALLLGGTTEVGGHVLAWYPVVTAVLTALLIYVSAVLVTDDRRIGLGAVALLAVLPGHAFRTGLGFADHHPFDYLWLAMTLAGLVVVARGARNERTRWARSAIVGGLLVAVGVTAQTLAWDNSPILLAALGPYIALESLRALRVDESPVRTAGPALAGLAVAAGVVWGIHNVPDWHTDLVAIAPVLLVLGGVGVVAVAEGGRRLGLSASVVAFGEVNLAVVGTVAFRSVRPDQWTRLTTSLDARLLAPRSIAEVQSIVSDSFGWLLLFGFVLVLALPYLAWATRRAATDGRWLPVVVYAWYFLVLSLVQARFVGELSPVLAVIAALGLVHLAERIDVARQPAPFTKVAPPYLELPDAREAGYLVILFLLVAGLSVIQVPVVTSKVTTPTELSETAFHLADRSDAEGLEYPDNYVFTEWGKNRVYNYFVSGESRSYSYAQSNYVDFVSSTAAADWYQRLRGRGGFVVTTPINDLQEDQIGAVLHWDNGSRTATHAGVGHYRLVFVSESGRYKAFALVPGAIVRGQVAANETVTLRTQVTVDGGSFTYVREARAGADGNYSVRVAHPGTYDVDGRPVAVGESAVENGSVVSVPVASSM